MNNKSLIVKFDNLRDYQVEALNHLFYVMDYLGNVGSSRDVSIYIDGDGSFRPKIYILNENYEQSKPIRSPIIQQESNYYMVTNNNYRILIDPSTSYKHPDFKVIVNDIFIKGCEWGITDRNKDLADIKVNKNY